MLTSLVGAFTPARGAEGDTPVVTTEDGTNGCNGVRSTPGSENTDKRLDPDYPSDFNPGGSVGFVIDYPVDAADVSGRTTFVITDCVFVDDVAVAKYSVSFVPNTTGFALHFAVPIAADTPLGAQFCNYAKTTAAPSQSQASNRKAGPACFTVGGGLRIEKRSGSTTGPLLGGASFSVVCAPAVAVPPTVITGLSGTSHTNPDGTVSASGSSVGGSIAVNGPSGTPCTVTETAAPPGYQLDATPRNLIVPIGTSQTVNVFVNRRLGDLVITKATTGGSGTFTFDVDCDGTAFDRSVTITDSGSRTIAGIPTGTTCTVTEQDDSQFTGFSVPADGTVTIVTGDNTVAFTNTRDTGNLVVSKTTTGASGTFTFDVDCDGSGFDQTLTIDGTGSQTVLGIPTGTSCTVTEHADARFASASVPADGRVTIDAGAATVTFTNTAKPTGIVLDKRVNGGEHASTRDALVVHAGDPLAYTVRVDNTGQVPVTLDELTDSLEPGFAAACPQGVGSTLAAGASFTCTYQRTARTSATNTASVEAVDGLGRHSRSSDSTFVTVINPAITITKTANPGSVTPGEAVTFSYTVTNAGDTTLTGVAVTDDVLGGIGLIETLAPGASATLTRTQTIQATTPPRNVGTATGTDTLGRTVSASATAEIVIVLGVVLERPQELPRTGGPISLLGVGGLALVLLGLVLRAGGDRRTERA